jgi:hypothetical protein
MNKIDTNGYSNSDNKSKSLHVMESLKTIRMVWTVMKC